MHVRYIIVDLEATCWDCGHDPSRMEIIEIGAVELSAGTGPTAREFAAFVRPVIEPELSEFCKQLTSIRQADLDAAEPFPRVFPRFLQWIGPELFTLGSWGAYDLNQFRLDCGRHGLEFPPAFERHINLKQEFARQHGVRLCGMDRALKLAGLPLEGTHHRAIDDARNIARLAMRVLREAEETRDTE